MQCPTVKIKSDNPDIPFIIINEEDFDPAKHELFSEAPAEAPAEAPITDKRGRKG